MNMVGRCLLRPIKTMNHVIQIAGFPRSLILSFRFRRFDHTSVRPRHSEKSSIIMCHHQFLIIRGGPTFPRDGRLICLHREVRKLVPPGEIRTGFACGGPRPRLRPVVALRGYDGQAFALLPFSFTHDEDGWLPASFPNFAVTSRRASSLAFNQGEDTPSIAKCGFPDRVCAVSGQKVGPRPKGRG